MASKKQFRLARLSAPPADNLIPAPQSSEEVLSLLKYAGDVAPDNQEVADHLAEMGALFPSELLGAFRAFLRRQTGSN